MCKRGASSVLLLALLLLPSHAPAPAAAEGDIALGDRVIVPGERIGRLRLAGTVADITSMLGPDSVRRAASGVWQNATYQEWSAASVAVVADNATGRLFWISVSAGPQGWAGVTTREGLGIGVTEEQLTRALGRPSREFSDGNGKSIYFDRAGIRFFLITTGSVTGRVGNVRVVWPHTTIGDGLIVGGERIGAVRLQMALSEVVRTLGDGYAQDPVGENAAYIWTHRGVRLLAKEQHVLSLGVFSSPFLDGAGVKYATPDNLAIGVTAADVRGILGEPSTRNEQPPLQWWLYPRRGVAVALNSQSRVALIEIFPLQRSAGQLLWVIVTAVATLLLVGYGAARRWRWFASPWSVRILTAILAAAAAIIVVLGVGARSAEIQKMTFWRSPGASGIFAGIVIVLLVLVGLAFYTTRRRQRRLLEPLRELLDDRTAETKATFLSRQASRLSGHIQGRAVRFELKEREEGGPAEFRIALAFHRPIFFEVRRPTRLRWLLRSRSGREFKTGDPALDRKFSFACHDSSTTSRDRLVSWLRRSEVRQAIQSLMDDHGITRLGTDLLIANGEEASAVLQAVYSPYKTAHAGVANIRSVLAQLHVLDDSLNHHWQS